MQWLRLLLLLLRPLLLRKTQPQSQSLVQAQAQEQEQEQVQGQVLAKAQWAGDLYPIARTSLPRPSSSTTTCPLRSLLQGTTAATTTSLSCTPQRPSTSMGQHTGPVGAGTAHDGPPTDTGTGTGTGVGTHLGRDRERAALCQL